LRFILRQRYAPMVLDTKNYGCVLPTARNAVAIKMVRTDGALCNFRGTFSTNGTQRCCLNKNITLLNTFKIPPSGGRGLLPYPPHNTQTFQLIQQRITWINPKFRTASWQSNIFGIVYNFYTQFAISAMFCKN
jgi:hypothetical protein